MHAIEDLDSWNLILGAKIGGERASSHLSLEIVMVVLLQELLTYYPACLSFAEHISAKIYLKTCVIIIWTQVRWSKNQDVGIKAMIPIHLPWAYSPLRCLLTTCSCFRCATAWYLARRNRRSKWLWKHGISSSAPAESLDHHLLGTLAQRDWGRLGYGRLGTLLYLLLLSFWCCKLS